MELKDSYVTALIAALWGITALLLIHGALFTPTETLRRMCLENGLEAAVGFISLIGLLLWLLFIRKTNNGR
jgi:predicted ferric reductase